MSDFPTPSRSRSFADLTVTRWRTWGTSCSNRRSRAASVKSFESVSPAGATQFPGTRTPTTTSGPAHAPSPTSSEPITNGAEASFAASSGDIPSDRFESRVPISCLLCIRIWSNMACGRYRFWASSPSENAPDKHANSNHLVSSDPKLQPNGFQSGEFRSRRLPKGRTGAVLYFSPLRSFPPAAEANRKDEASSRPQLV